MTRTFTFSIGFKTFLCYFRTEKKRGKNHLAKVYICWNFWGFITHQVCNSTPNLLFKYMACVLWVKIIDKYCIYIFIYYIDLTWTQSPFFQNLPRRGHPVGTDQSRTEFRGMSVTVNQSETEFDDVIISDWPSVIICLLIWAGRWQMDLALMRVLYNIYIYIYIQYFSMLRTDS